MNDFIISNNWCNHHYYHGRTSSTETATPTPIPTTTTTTASGQVVALLIALLIASLALAVAPAPQTLRPKDTHRLFFICILIQLICCCCCCWLLASATLSFILRLANTQSTSSWHVQCLIVLLAEARSFRLTWLIAHTLAGVTLRSNVVSLR